MNKLNVSYLIIFVLLAINLLLSLKIYEPARVQENGPLRLPHEILIERLEFNESQQTALMTKIAPYLSEMKSNQEVLMHNKNKIFSSVIKQDLKPNQVLLATNEIGNRMSKIDYNLQTVLTEIYKTCNPSQKIKMQEIMGKIFKDFGDKKFHNKL